MYRIGLGWGMSSTNKFLHQDFVCKTPQYIYLHQLLKNIYTLTVESLMERYFHYKYIFNQSADKKYHPKLDTFHITVWNVWDTLWRLILLFYSLQLFLRKLTHFQKMTSLPQKSKLSILKIPQKDAYCRILKLHYDNLSAQGCKMTYWRP